MDQIRQYLSDFGIIITSELIDNYTTNNYHDLIDKSSNWQQPLTLNLATVCQSTCSGFLEAVCYCY